MGAVPDKHDRIEMPRVVFPVGYANLDPEDRAITWLASERVWGDRGDYRRPANTATVSCQKGAPVSISCVPESDRILCDLLGNIYLRVIFGGIHSTVSVVMQP